MKNEKILEALNGYKLTNDIAYIDSLIQTISEEIKESELKKLNGVDYVKLSKKAKKILAKNEKDCFKTAAMETIDGKEMQVFFDNGYYAIALYRPLDVPMDKADETFKGAPIFEKTKNSSYKEIVYDIGEIKLALITAVDKKCPYAEVGNTRYNVQFFLNVVEFLGGAKKTKFYQGESRLAPAYFESEFGKAILCPVRPVRKV